VFTIADYIASVRSLIWDAATSKIVKPDDLTQQVVPGDSRVSFTASNQNIVNANMQGQSYKVLQSTDGAAFVGTGITLTDAFNGIVTLTTPPTKSLRIIYYFQFFQDADVQAFVYNGLRQIGIDPTSATAIGEVPQQLFQAPCYLAAAEALKANAQLYVKFYSITTGGKGFQKGDKFKNVQAQAMAYEKTAREIRADYYTIQNRGLRPAATTRGAGGRTAPPYAGDSFQPRR
jgi:phage terminase large subunit-like protein